MKQHKLNLIKPDIRTVYTRQGKGQEIKYLQLDNNINVASLREDVENGAEEFRELLSYEQKAPRKVTIINAQSREEAFMAVSYLAMYYNRYDTAMSYRTLGTDLDSEDLELDGDEESCIDELSQKAEDLKFDDDTESISRDEDGNAVFNGMDSDDEGWEENAMKVPVVEFGKIATYLSNNVNAYSNGRFAMGGMGVQMPEEPYWLGLHQASVCIVRDAGWSMPWPAVREGEEPPSISKVIERFSACRHIFMVIVSRKSQADSMEYLEASSIETEVCEAILQFVAEKINIGADSELMEKYRIAQFEGHVALAGKKLSMNFNIGSIVRRIVSINNDDKSELIGRVVKYVANECPMADVLTEDNFDVLKKFRLLGIKEEKKAGKILADDIIGLDSVKEQIDRIVSVAKFNKKRQELGLCESGFHNVFLFLGAPGTAKTTVAQLLGNIMMEEKLLPGNRFRSCNGAELKGMFVGHSAPKVHALFEENDVILIDEAYSIVTEGDTDSFGEEAIAQLILELEKHGTDKLVMFAGYGGRNVTDRNNKMKQFIDANPGIRSRINGTIYFESYTPGQMVNIFKCIARQKKLEIESSADKILMEYFSGRVSDPNFGNGREARSMLENAMSQTAARVMKLPPEQITKKALSTITAVDVKKALDYIDLGYSMQNGPERKVCGF